MSMNHHGAFPHPSNSDGPENDKHMADLLKGFEQQLKGEKVRSFPHGRIAGEDDGELIYKVGSDPDKGVVIVYFGKQVSWLGLEPKDAVTLAQMLIKHARAISKEPITIALY